LGLPRQTPRDELIQKFRALGWQGPTSGGRHMFMKKGALKVHIPNPHHGEIGVGLLREILRQAAITTEDWNDA
jgi:predicted RNA binding protein YcfA (HicA-like mRNA interferase family)